MPKFNFELPVKLQHEKTFDKIKNFLSAENDFKKFDPKLTCSFDDGQKKCQLNGSQFKAQLTVLPVGSDSKIHIEVEVPLALAFFKGKIQSYIEKNMSKILG